MGNKQKLYGMLGLCAKAGKVVAGNQAVLEAIEKRKIKLLILAEDSSDRTKEMFQKIGEEKKIKIVICLTMEELSEKIGYSKFSKFIYTNQELEILDNKNIYKVAGENIYYF